MFHGSVSLRSKQPNLLALNVFYVGKDSELFIFDDKLVIAYGNSLNNLLRAAAPLVGHGIGALGWIAKKMPDGERSRRRELSPDLTPAQLNDYVGRTVVAPIEHLRTVKLTTALRPITQVGGTDLTFKLSTTMDKGVRLGDAFGFGKQHITSPVGQAQQLLTLVLGDKLEDRQFEWARKS